MPFIIYTKTAVCSGGDHVVLTRTGAKNGTRQVSVSDVFQNTPSADELLIAEMIFLRQFANGKTKGQLNAAFTAGVRLSYEQEV